MSIRNKIAAAILVTAAFNAARAEGAIVLDFDTLGGTSAPSPIVEDGFQVTSKSGNNINVVNAGQTAFNGSTSIFNEAPGDGIEITKQDGSAFSLDSIDVDNLLSNDPVFSAFLSEFTLTFNAVTAEGDNVEKSVIVNKGPGFQTVFFDDVPGFSNIVSASVDQGLGLTEGIHFDNIVASIATSNTNAIPAPAALPAGLALIGLIAAGRRRANARISGQIQPPQL